MWLTQNQFFFFLWICWISNKLEDTEFVKIAESAHSFSDKHIFPSLLGHSDNSGRLLIGGFILLQQTCWSPSLSKGQVESWGFESSRLRVSLSENFDVALPRRELRPDLLKAFEESLLPRRGDHGNQKARPAWVNGHRQLARWRKK